MVWSLKEGVGFSGGRLVFGQGRIGLWVSESVRPRIRKLHMIPHREMF